MARSLPCRPVTKTRWVTGASRCCALTRLESALPRPLLKCKQIAPVSQLLSTLTSPLNLYQSKGFKLPSFDTFTKNSHVTPLECALTEIPGGRGTPPIPPRFSRNTLNTNRIIWFSLAPQSVDNQPSSRRYLV